MRILRHFYYGQSMADYGFIILLLSVVVIVSASNLGTMVNSTFNTTTQKLDNVEANVGVAASFGPTSTSYLGTSSTSCPNSNCF